MSTIRDRENDETQELLQRGTITLIRALVNRIEALSPGGRLPTAQPAIESLLSTAKEMGCKKVYAEIESMLVTIVQEMETAGSRVVPLELAAARTRIRALLDRFERLSSTACAPGSRDHVEVVADNEEACVELGRALLTIIQEYEEIACESTENAGRRREN